MRSMCICVTVVIFFFMSCNCFAADTGEGNDRPTICARIGLKALDLAHGVQTGIADQQHTLGVQLSEFAIQGIEHRASAYDSGGKVVAEHYGVQSEKASMTGLMSSIIG